VFIIAMIVMNGVSFGAILGMVGWPMLQAAGLVAESAIETQQHRQAAELSRVEATVDTLHASVIMMGARVDAVRDRQDAAGRHLAELDMSVGALRTSVDEIRTAQNAAKEAWREPLAELATAAAKTRGEVTRLRTSVDELSRTRQPEGLSARVDRIEQTLGQRNPLGPMRGSIQEPAERPTTDGHIINLTPAR
jgi:chromosome segregation ATPase